MLPLAVFRYLRCVCCVWPVNVTVVATVLFQGRSRTHRALSTPSVVCRLPYILLMCRSRCEKHSGNKVDLNYIGPLAALLPNVDSALTVADGEPAKRDCGLVDVDIYYLRETKTVCWLATSYEPTTQWVRTFSRDGITPVRHEMTWTSLISSGVKERREQFWSVYIGVARCT